MKRAVAVLLVLASVAGHASVLTTGVQLAEEPVEASDTDVVDKAIDDIYVGKAANALRTFDDALKRTDDRNAKAYLKALRGLAFLSLKKPVEARAEFAEGTKLAPNTPEVDRLRFIGGLEFGSREEASLGLDRMLAAFPDVIHTLPEEYVSGYLSMKEGKGLKAVDDQRIGLAQIGFGGNSGDYLAVSAVELLIKRGRVDDAKALIPHIDERSALEVALIQKKFAPVWQAIEAHAGLRMSRVEDEAVRLARIDFDEKPDDPKKLHILISALSEARRYQEAIDVGSKFAVSPLEMAKVDVQGGWVVNGHASALYRAKRFAEGDARFAALNAAHDENWIVSMKINRLAALVRTGRYSEASQLITLTEESAISQGNDYARQLVRRLKLCIFHRIGRTAEATALLAEMKAKAADAPAATVEGLLCIGDIDAAEKVVLDTLSGNDDHASMLLELQRRPLDSDDPSEWRKSWQDLRGRPAVSAAFDKVGRDLPDAMYPES